MSVANDGLGSARGLAAVVATALWAVFPRSVVCFTREASREEQGEYDASPHRFQLCSSRTSEIIHTGGVVR